MTFSQWVKTNGIKAGAGKYMLYCPVCQVKKKNRALVIDLFSDAPPKLFCFSSQCAFHTIVESIGYTWDEVKAETGIPDVPSQHGPKRDPEEVRAKIEKLLAKSQPWVVEDVVDRYLSFRGLSARSDELRTVQRLYHTKSDYTRGMICPIRDVHGTIVGIHKTFLTDEGRKAELEGMNKRILGEVKGAAMRLFPANDEVALAEGIETALAVQEMTGWPVWVASSSHFKALALPETIRTVRICADHDLDGLNRARELAARLKSEDRKVHLYKPQVEGHDFLDQILARRKNQALPPST